jgi:hypothetical protein
MLLPMPLPIPLTEHLSSRLALEFSERDTPYKVELKKTVSMYAAKGMLGSSGCVLAVIDQGRIEFKTRTQLMLSHFSRTVAVFDQGYETGVGIEANCLLQEVLATQREHVRGIAEEYARKSGVFSPTFFSDFDEAADREARRIESELQLWEVRLKQQKESPASIRNVVNISGSFNLVQAGTVGSAASIIVDADSRDALLQALGSLLDALPAADELNDTQKTELRQVIDDCEREIKEATPNRSRLFDRSKQ